MGWDLHPSGNTQIYNYNIQPGNANYHKYIATDEIRGYYSWARNTVWSRQEATIRYINDTGVPMAISNIKVKYVACDSGGRTYWSSSGVISACSGYGADYRVYVRVTNDGGSTFTESSVSTNDVPNISGTNMNSRGSSEAETAQFGNYPRNGEFPATPDRLLQLRDHPITDCPVIQPGGWAYIHFGVYNFKGTPCTIRFQLQAQDMEVQFDPGIRPYVWVFEDDKQWHLRRPFYVMKDGTWVNVEDFNKAGN